MRLAEFPKKRGLLTALLVVAGLAMTVTVARATTPAITDSTTPPAGHFSGACSGCHVVELRVPEVPGPGALDSDRSAEAADPSDEATEAVEVDDHGGDQGDHQDAASPGNGDIDEQAGDQNDRGENDADAHETVTPHVQERTHHDLHSSDQGDQDDRSSDQGGASQHDGGGEGSGSSD
jgi:hypothetical protein